MEFRRVLSRSEQDRDQGEREARGGERADLQAGSREADGDESGRDQRSEERRVGEEGISRWEWSSDVCSPDLSGFVIRASAKPAAASGPIFRPAPARPMATNPAAI